MAPEQTSDDFDWVGAQAKCTAAAMFDRLRAEVEEDVRRRNGILDREDGWRFEVDGEEDEFEVSRVVGSGPNGRKVTAAVIFERVGRRIHVQGEEVDVDFTAIVSLDTTGACRFVVGEAMYSDWELRRMALEVLFFEDTGHSE